MTSQSLQQLFDSIKEICLQPWEDNGTKVSEQLIGSIVNLTNAELQELRSEIESKLQSGFGWTDEQWAINNRAAVFYDLITSRLSPHPEPDWVKDEPWQIDGTGKTKPLSEKIIQHKVVLDLNPDEDNFTGVPQWVSLDLHKDGEWYCSYQGFVDAAQLEELRSTYEVKEGEVEGMLRRLNEELRDGLDFRDALNSMRELKQANRKAAS